MVQEILFFVAQPSTGGVYTKFGGIFLYIWFTCFCTYP
jgi:hypothetical protein